MSVESKDKNNRQQQVNACLVTVKCLNKVIDRTKEECFRRERLLGAKITVIGSALALLNAFHHIRQMAALPNTNLAKMNDLSLSLVASTFIITILMGAVQHHIEKKNKKKIVSHIASLETWKCRFSEKAKKYSLS